MSCAVGVDVAEERKGLDVVALDSERRVVASHGGLRVEEVTDLVLGALRPGIVCIDSPSGWSATDGRRQSEVQLAALGIASFPTGPDPGEHRFYRWVRVGISLFEALAVDYPLFRGRHAVGTAAETFPNASAILLARRRRDKGETKNRFRRKVLESCGVDGSVLPDLDRVDAALCALTGVLALGGCWSAAGDPSEGAILLPVRATSARKGSSAPAPSTRSGG